MPRRKSRHRPPSLSSSLSLSSRGALRPAADATRTDVPHEEYRAGEAASLVRTGDTPPSSASTSVSMPSSPADRIQAAATAGTGGITPTKPPHRSFAIDINNEEPPPTLIPTPMSPRHDPQLGGYPPDCGSEELKYLSYAKVLHDRGQTHPMRYSTTEFDAFGNPKPQKYPLGTDFGAHAFHRLPTDSFVLSQYGVGMTLYFKYLKVMTWLFFLLVLLSAPALVTYIVGGKGSLAEFKVLARQNLPMILGMTSIGHLKESSSLCEQVPEGNTLSLTCPAGEIGFVKAMYSTQDSQGTCGCPEINNVAAGSGKCRGKPVISCSSPNTSSSSSSASDTCMQICPPDGYGCFLGVHPVSKWACCAKALDAKTNTPNFDDMRIRSTPGCDSGAIQTIVDGLCLGKSSCAMNVSEELMYEWKVNEMYETFCLHEEGDKTPGATCSVRINDDSDYSQCSSGSKRSPIVYARCFTTRIDLSNEWSLKIIGWDSISRQDFLGLAIGCDIACSMCFFFIVIWMKRKKQENVARITKDQIKALDYTVQLVHLPRHRNVSKLREEIRTHLEKVLNEAPRYTKDVDRIRIANIQFGMNTSGHLELLRNRGVVVRRLDVALQRYGKLPVLYGRLSQKAFEKRRRRHEKRIKRLENKLMRHNARLDRWNANHKKRASIQAVTAFITFEEEEGSHRCLAEYPDLGFIYRLFQPRYERLRGKRLRFRPAPDPTDIVWENLHYPYWSRLLRQLVVALITLAVLFMSFILIFLAKLQKTKLEREFGRPTSCPVGVTKDDVAQDELEKKTGLVPYKALVECYCKTVLATKSFHSMTKESFLIPSSSSSGSDGEPPTEAFYCKTWATSYVTTQFLSFLSVLMVVFINVLLAKILNVLVGMEKHHTESSQVVSRVTKVFLAQFCNTAVLMVVINANLGYFLDHTDFELSLLPILNGKYSDFTPTWYNDVGVALMLTMIINTFSPHVYVVANYLALEAQRFYDRGFSFNFARTRQDTQRDLDALYRGPKFDLAARYAQTLTSIFIIYLLACRDRIADLCVWKWLVLRLIILRWDAAAAPRGLLRDAHDVLDRQIHVPPHCSAAAVVRQQSGECSEVAAAVRGAAPLGDRDLDVLKRAHLPIVSLARGFFKIASLTHVVCFSHAQQPGDIASELTTVTSEIGENIPTFDQVRGEIWTRITRPQVVVLFGFFVAFCLIVLVKIVLFEYFPSVLQSFCPMLTRLMQKSRAAKGIPNYFDAIPTPILREKATDPRVKSTLRKKYRQVLEKREALLGGGSSAGLGSSPRRRNRRSISAAEQYSDAQWIVGCASYAISDNKEYVDQLAIDSQLSEGISIEEIFCKDVGSDQAAPSGLSETYLVSQLSVY